MATSLSLTAIYEPIEDGWVGARFKELPQVFTEGRNEEEAREMLLDALREYLLALVQESGEQPIDSEAKLEPLSLTLG